MRTEGQTKVPRHPVLGPCPGHAREVGSFALQSVHDAVGELALEGRPARSRLVVLCRCEAGGHVAEGEAGRAAACTGSSQPRGRRQAVGHPARKPRHGSDRGIWRCLAVSGGVLRLIGVGFGGSKLSGPHAVTSGVVCSQVAGRWSGVVNPSSFCQAPELKMRAKGKMWKLPAPVDPHKTGVPSYNTPCTRTVSRTASEDTSTPASANCWSRHRVCDPKVKLRQLKSG